ncbi:hypothetical protein GALL_484230 [mine drainage metagenome]|uniref:Uncharacterized protein n=1 Tax=mine drainage metagenome TaxID=410659 RepID=A0A1J5PQX4_9ZZZZ
MQRVALHGLAPGRERRLQPALQQVRQPGRQQEAQQGIGPQRDKDRSAQHDTGTQRPAAAIRARGIGLRMQQGGEGLGEPVHGLQTRDHDAARRVNG